MGGVNAREPGFAAALRAVIRGDVRENEPLSRYSTYRIGGPATVVLPSAAEDVARALQTANQAGVPWFVVGLGSNLLFPDNGLDALVIRLGKGVDRMESAGESWRLGAGLPGPLAARRSAEAGWAGLHKFVGVPGAVGGGIYMNAGCHGGEWAEVVTRVLVVDGNGQERWLMRADVPFTYRRSGLDGLVVLEADVLLRADRKERLAEEVADLFRWRQNGTPFNQPCCGSVFKNPGGPSWEHREGPRTAGQLIEAAGLKGTRSGGAEISPMHANYFVNAGGASAADVLALITLARSRVSEQFGVTLEPEVKLIGPRGEYLHV